VQFLRPHAKADVVIGAGLIASGGRKEPVAGDKIGARMVPPEIDRDHVGVGDAPIGLIDVLDDPLGFHRGRGNRGHEAIVGAEKLYLRDPDDQRRHDAKVETLEPAGGKEIAISILDGVGRPLAEGQ
jgi:hypothetical protein